MTKKRRNCALEIDIVRNVKNWSNELNCSIYNELKNNMLYNLKCLLSRQRRLKDRSNTSELVNTQL